MRGIFFHRLKAVCLSIYGKIQLRKGLINNVRPPLKDEAWSLKRRRRGCPEGRDHPRNGRGGGDGLHSGDRRILTRLSLKLAV